MLGFSYIIDIDDLVTSQILLLDVHVIAWCRWDWGWWSTYAFL